MRTLVIGGSCLLGRYLDREMECVSTWNVCYQDWTRYQMNVTNQRSVLDVFGRVKPTHVIMLAAAGDVDWVQQNYLAAKEINLDGVRNVLEVAADYQAHVVYTSSNAVFSGNDPPYGPPSKREPINAYGKMRRVAEDIVTEYKYRWTVARLFLLYGWQPNGARGNWATRIINALNQQETVSLVDDRYWQPSYAGHVSEAIQSLVETGVSGFWHIMGQDRVTLHEFGLAVADMFGFDPGRVQSMHSDELPPAIAPRPIDSSYDPDAENTIILPGVMEGLAVMRDEWCGYGCEVAQPYGWVPEAGCPVHD